MSRHAALRASVPAALLALLAGAHAACRTSHDAPREAAELDRVGARIDRLESFLAARRAGNLARARGHLGPDPRVRYGEDAGPGAPWSLEGGRWRDWDAHFRGESRREGEWHVEGDDVWADMFETNDYYRLTERGGGWWRATYTFDAEHRIVGLRVSAAPGRAKPAGRADEFAAWALAHRPEEAEYLMPGGSIDPTGDRAPRMRALLDEWRAAVGLPPLSP